MKQNHASHHVFHTLRNWLMLVPMRLAHPANHQRMIEEMPSKATLVNELDELELRTLHFPPSPTGTHQVSTYKFSPKERFLKHFLLESTRCAGTV